MIVCSASKIGQEEYWKTGDGGQLLLNLYWWHMSMLVLFSIRNSVDWPEKTQGLTFSKLMDLLSVILCLDYVYIYIII